MRIVKSATSDDSELEGSETGNSLLPKFHSLKTLAHILWLKRWTFVALWAALALPTGGVLTFVDLPRTYNASTIIRFPLVVGAQNNVMRDVAISQGESIVNVFTSFKVLEATVRKLYLRLQIETPETFRHDLFEEVRYSDSLATGFYKIRIEGSTAMVEYHSVGKPKDIVAVRDSLREGRRLVSPGLELSFTPEFMSRNNRVVELRLLPMESAVGMLKKGIAVRPLGQSNFQINLSDRDPVFVAEILNTLRGEFLNEYYGTTAGQDVGIMEQMEKDLEQAKKNLERSQNTLSQLYADHPQLMQQQRSARPDENLNYLESRQDLAALESRKTRIVAAYQAKPPKDQKEERFYWASDLLGAMIDAGEAHATVLRGRLAELNNQLLTLKSTLGPEHPRLLEAYATMEDVYSEIDSAEQTFIRQLDSKKSSLQLKVSQLAPTQAQDIPVKVRLELDRLNQAVQGAQQIYDHLLDGYNRAKLVTGSEFFKVTVVDEARPAGYTPPSLKSRLLFALAAVLSLGIILPVLMGLRFMIFQTIWTLDDLKRLLRVKPLGSIAQGLKTQGQTSAAQIDPHLLFYGSAHTLADLEAYRMIREEVESFYRNPNRPGKLVLLVTSTRPEEGKTLISSNLAITFARKGKRTLLIDADFRLGRIAQAFNISPTTGLDEMLAQDYLDESEFLAASNLCWVPSAQKDLVLVPRKNFNPNAGEMVSSDKFKAFIRMVSEQFDVVIIDTPPMTITSEPLSLAEITDGVLFASRSGHTVLSEAKEAVDLLRERGVKVGAVLNGVRHTPFENDRYRRYAHYYHGGDRSA